MKNSVLLIFLGLLGFAIAGCNQEDPEDEECPIATMRTNRIEQDTLCQGTWSWTHSLKWHDDFQGGWVLTDTIYPGEDLVGFETVNDATVMISDNEIYVVKNSVCSGGCYKYWSSQYQYHSTGPSDTVVYCLFEAWELASYLGMSVYVSDSLPKLIIKRKLARSCSMFLTKRDKASVIETDM
mgnify:CR=1 FL=1